MALSEQNGKWPIQFASCARIFEIVTPVSDPPDITRNTWPGTEVLQAVKRSPGFRWHTQWPQRAPKRAG